MRTWPIFIFCQTPLLGDASIDSMPTIRKKSGLFGGLVLGQSIEVSAERPWDVLPACLGVGPKAAVHDVSERQLGEVETQFDGVGLGRPLDHQSSFVTLCAALARGCRGWKRWR